MNTFYQLWGVKTPAEAKAKVAEQRKAYEFISEPANLEEQALKLCGKDIYTRLIKGYTEKQWGRPATELPSFIIKRVPFRFIFDNNYFNDAYQGIPKGGYNVLIDALLEGIEVRWTRTILKTVRLGMLWPIKFFSPVALMNISIINADVWNTVACVLTIVIWR